MNKRATIDQLKKKSREQHHLPIVSHWEDAVTRERVTILLKTIDKTDCDDLCSLLNEMSMICHSEHFPILKYQWQDEYKRLMANVFHTLNAFHHDLSLELYYKELSNSLSIIYKNDIEQMTTSLYRLICFLLLYRRKALEPMATSIPNDQLGPKPFYDLVLDHCCTLLDLSAKRLSCRDDLKSMIEHIPTRLYDAYNSLHNNSLLKHLLIRKAKRLLEYQSNRYKRMSESFKEEELSPEDALALHSSIAQYIDEDIYHHSFQLKQYNSLFIDL